MAKIVFHSPSKEGLRQELQALQAAVPITDAKASEATRRATEALTELARFVRETNGR